MDILPPIAILDTNVVLDCLVFHELGCRPLMAALEGRRLRWLASEWMRAELQHVLSRGIGPRWFVDRSEVDAQWRHWAEPAPEPPPQPPARSLRCADPQDQPFIDLALAVGARWLLSRDRAVLRLSRKAAPRGLAILTPEAWARDDSAS